MNLQLEGKIAVVTGASRGIGLAITRALVDEGVKVVAGARGVAPLEGIAGITAVALDLTTPEGPAELVRRAVATHDRIDILVNNVGGVRIRFDGFLATSDDEFTWALQMNFFPALRATRAAITQMLQQGGGGAVVNVASVNSFFQPNAGTIDYGAAKAALANLTKSLSQEFGPRGIRINDVSPGPVTTELWMGESGVASTAARRMGVDVETARARIVESMGGIPTGRFTTPEEVATLVTLLASPRAGNVTGSNFVVDGGLIKTL